ncbi:hypothetical protein GGQ92_000621 [Gracilibacillus halotolerans]|uniref:Holin-like toxin n=1 Tax=Gracilibacillus halotolerans TaxID=74386 RepID=A0A841RLM6_9BACI|nr:putative holin-like toxin [Gracilibacillus halotolerans]MBB6511854.1 hypothetical protein [Gracilibacillus halotolerans]
MSVYESIMTMLSFGTLIIALIALVVTMNKKK